ncbi:hypothetical protein HPB49_005070 [Dermacentor silvarum]|uniref:Uncharacterized protein n=1 Tax=Dermacentor silvarum TaxID=543639 RepID=A0ACB8D313_DERSI|nr:hypothetical protein HPB49_005070 [Dermacentor silvarum]
MGRPISLAQQTARDNSADFNVHETNNKGPPATRGASLPTTEVRHRASPEKPPGLLPETRLQGKNSAGNKTPSSKENKNRKTSGQSAKPPAFQEGDFSPLGNSKAAITSKVSNWAEIASTPSPSHSPLELELRKEIAFLRTQNEQLEQKVIALQNLREEPPFPGTLDSGDESVSLCSGMGPVTYDPLNSNLESRMTALGKSVADQIAPLSTMIAQIMQAQMQPPVTTLTKQITAAVTQNIKSWIQASPKLFKWAGPVKELGRPSKICRNIDEDDTEAVRSLLPFKQR